MNVTHIHNQTIRCTLPFAGSKRQPSSQNIQILHFCLPFVQRGGEMSDLPFVLFPYIFFSFAYYFWPSGLPSPLSNPYHFLLLSLVTLVRCGGERVSSPFSFFLLSLPHIHHHIQHSSILLASFHPSHLCGKWS